MAKTEIVTVPKFDRNTMFEFRTGLSKGTIILVDYKKGELMRNGSCGVRVFSPGDMAWRVRTGFSFEQKHTKVVLTSTNPSLQKGL
jgi:ribosomal protein S8E